MCAADDAFVKHCTSLSPAALDIELRTLSPDCFAPFIRVSLFHMRSRKSFELAQAWLNVFVKLHGDMLSRDDTCRTLLSELLHMHQQEWGRIEASMRFCNCTLDFVRSL